MGHDGVQRKKILTLWNFTSSGGYSGVDATPRKVMAYFYWKGIRKNILDFIYNCDIFQRNKYDTSTYPGFLQPLSIPTTPWADVNMNFIKGLPKFKGKTVIWIIVDGLTNYGHFVVLAHPYTAQTLAPVFMDTIFKLHGFPASITSDRDPIFINSFWKEFLSV